MSAAVTYSTLAADLVTERHFFRCHRCCFVFALEGPAAPKARCRNGHRLPASMCPDWISGTRCDCGCDRLEWMGRVGPGGLVREEDHCACDSRCTSARGPKCNCECGGRNHGTGAVVRTRVVSGVPVVDGTDSLDRRLAGVQAWERALEAAAARVDANPAVVEMRAGRWVNDRDAWEHAKDMLAALRNNRKYKTLPARIRALERIGS